MELIRNFKELSKNNADIAGGKGASLGEMTQAGIPVPPGFVVLSESFEQFLHETDLVQEIDSILHKVNHKEIHTVESASEAIRALILSRDMPEDIAQAIHISFKELNAKYVAVRSSATAEDGKDHAWAGQLESYLNTTEDDVLTKVKLCWSSLFTPRAIFYRFEKELHATKISVAVVVQKMVESELSGIAFSVHPVTEDYNQLIIEAGFGLGEAIVSGSVTPDSYVVEKEPRNILDKNISTQERGLYRSENISAEHGNNEWMTIAEPKASSQVLTDAQILELSEIILTIENHYGFPCDIEWAWEAGKFYIVQSRPITTLSAGSKNINTNQSSVDWSLYISRPFDLFVTSVWNMWYAGDLMKKIIGVNMQKGLFIEYPRNTSNHFRDVSAIDEMKNRIADIALSEPKKALEILQKGIELNKNVSNVINEKKTATVDEALATLIELAIYSVIFPMFAVEKLDEQNPAHTEILNACKELRSESYYPRFLSGILIPSVKAKLKSHGVNEDDYAFLTIHEVLTDDFAHIQNRKEYAEKGECYVYRYIDGVEEIKYVDNSEKLFSEIEKSENSSISGQSTYPGKVTGKVRKLLSNNPNTPFEEGEILVAISTNPDIIPLMKKAGAIVTDEGGIMCHASIISRELKIPCIVGTKNATRALKDGDMVEVDANTGIIKIIN